MRIRPVIARMGEYKPPLEKRTQGDHLLLDFNESTQPPGPEVVAAVKAFLDSGRVRNYPAYGGLMEKLAAYTGQPRERLLVTNGSDQAIDVVCRALVDEGDEVIFPRPGFFMIGHLAALQGARVVSPHYGPDMSFPLQGVLDAVTERTRLIVLTSPNNPTGTSLTEEQLRTVLERCPDAAVLVDEVYYEFCGRTCAHLLDEYDRLVVTRSFSKAFALAGLRIGYAMTSPEFVRTLQTVRGPYDVNILAAKAAEASLEHPQHWRAYVDEVMTHAKPMVERFFEEHGVTYFPSDANFLLVRPRDVGEACAFLEREGILVRPQRAPIADTFRVSIGTAAEMQRFMQAYARYLGRDGGAAPARG